MADSEIFFQIWNAKSESVEKSKVLKKVHSVLPNVRFIAEFYKRKQSFSLVKLGRILYQIQITQTIHGTYFIFSSDIFLIF